MLAFKKKSFVVFLIILTLLSLFFLDNFMDYVDKLSDKTNKNDALIHQLEDKIERQ